MKYSAPPLLCRPLGAVLAFGPLPQPLQLPLLQRLRDRRGRTGPGPEGAAGVAHEDVCGELEHTRPDVPLTAAVVCVTADSFPSASDVLVQLSCKLEREFRCVELAEMMPHNVVTLAIKYASRSRRLALAQRLSEIALEKASQTQDDEIEEQEEDRDYCSIRPASG